MPTEVRHLHHIVPRHAGGSDEWSNLISLTVSQHADAHFIRWITCGDFEDYLAYIGLMKIAPKADIIHQLNSESAKRRQAKEKAEDPIGYSAKRARGGRACYDKTNQFAGCLSAAHANASARAKRLPKEQMSSMGKTKYRYRCLVCGESHGVTHSHFRQTPKGERTTL